MIADRVGQWTKSKAHENFLLEEALPLHRKFEIAFQQKSNCYYTCLNEESNQWEVGIGEFVISENRHVLIRKNILSSSEQNRKVSFANGKKAVFVSLPSKAITDLEGNTALPMASMGISLTGDTVGICEASSGSLSVNTKIDAIQGIKVFNGNNPIGEKDLAVDGFLYATRVHNSVWNDIVDFQRLNDELKFGYCYYDTFEGAQVCNKRCQKSVVGIASDTYGMAVGLRQDLKQVPLAVAGWVLAYVDRIYEPGTVLTNNESGILTEMSQEEKSLYPERIVALFKSPEHDEFFGQSHKVKVDGRCWVKVR
jgi:hypothetical protein